MKGREHEPEIDSYRHAHCDNCDRPADTKTHDALGNIRCALARRASEIRRFDRQNIRSVMGDSMNMVHKAMHSETTPSTKSAGRTNQ